MIHYKKDYRNIVTLTLDMKGSSVNIINHEVAKAFVPVIDQLYKDAQQRQLAGVIITSAKRSFLAGGDLDYLHNADNAQMVFDYSMTLNTVFRRLELLGVPIVAAINGAALGSGYELTLACHYRIALDTPHTVIGLPEVGIGMIPGGGSVVRLTWLLGIEAAFEVISRGKAYHVKEAFQRGLVDAIASDPRELWELAHKFINSKPSLTKIWDKSTEPPILCNPKHPHTAQMLTELNAQTLKRTHDNYPAVQTVLNTIYECMQLDFEQAMKIVSRHFTALVLSRACRNMTKAFWYDVNKIKNGASRPKGYGRFRARKIGIIGAGAMGSGIAYLAALEGVQVVLKDISVSIAQQGKEFVRRTLDNLEQKGKLTREQVKAVLDRVHPSGNLGDLEECDLVLEAVFENKELKSRIVREAEMYVHRDSFIASNSATLSITELADGCARPHNFIGMHFFAPVVQSNLVEIVVGKQTNTETLARAFDFVRHLGKTPIVVQDKAGFYTMRVFRTYMLEGMALLQEGQPAAYIRNLALQSGMQEGPFALADQFSLNFALELEYKNAQALGNAYDQHPAVSVLEKMVEMKRQGKNKGAGFYEYNDKTDERTFWAGLEEHFPLAKQLLSAQEIKDRIMFVQCIEAARCLEEGIVKSSADANLGSIYGWGFPAFKGGVLQFINDYGVPEFVERAHQLQTRYGKRFAVPNLLLEMVKEQTNFI